MRTIYGTSSFDSSSSFAGWDDPFPGGDVYDPEALLRLLDTCLERNNQDAEAFRIHHYLRERLSARIGPLTALRRESTRLLARTMRLVLKSIMLGRIDFRSDPFDRVVIQAFSYLWLRYLWNRLLQAYDDSIVAGVGGVAFSPFGIGLLRPENFFAYPNFNRPVWTARLFAVPQKQVLAVFKRRFEPIMGRTEPSDQPETWSELPSVLVTEVVGPKTITYYVNGRRLVRIARPAGHGHHYLIGDPRTVRVYTQPRDLEAVQIADSIRAATYGDQIVRIEWNNERDPRMLDLPVGLLEQVAEIEHQGYNILAWYEVILDAMLKRVQRGNVIGVRPDLLDQNDEVTQAFLEFYRPIATLGGESPSAAVQFLDVVPFEELKAMLIEVQNLFSAVTGITPYHMAQVGVSDVASEVVAMQSQTNARINQLHSQVVQWISRVTDMYRSYLATLPQEDQEPIYIGISEGGYEYERYGSFIVVGSPEAPYSAIFENTRIEPTLVGELALVNRRNELIQALQVVAQATPVLAQMGRMYDLTRIIDPILVTLGLDPDQLRIELGPVPGEAPGTTHTQANTQTTGGS